MTFRNACALVLGVFLALPGLLRGDEHYYLVVFAAERSSTQPATSHTFATFVKAIDEEDFGEEEFPLEIHTISWMPESLDIVALRRFAENGRNLDLAATFAWAKTVQARLFVWGPYRIDKDLFDKACAQIRRLQSGQVAYKILDRRFRPQACNCIHAVTDVVSQEGFLLTGRFFGVPASRMVIGHFQPWIIHPNETHAWLKDRMGLEKMGVVLHFMEERLGKTGREQP